jgi:tetratricopeptide (TPR) repeat protein
VTVSLIDARRDTQIWSNTYDRDAALQSVFELQSEISSTITSSLRAALTPEERERLTTIPTKNVEAYELFVAGTINLSQRSFDTLLSARQQFEEAVALDPKYARAYAALAETVMVLYINHQAIAPSEARRIAGDAVAMALRLDPENPEAYAVRGLIEAKRWEQTRVGDGNVRAADDFRRALDLNSNYANAYVWFSTLRDNENDVEAAIQLLATALEKDPRNRTPFINLPGLLSIRGENVATTDLLLKAMEFFPGWDLPYPNLSQHLQKLGRLDEAIAWSIEHARISDDPLAGANAMGIYRLFGHTDAIAAFMADFPVDHPVTPIGLGYQKFVEGDYEATIKVLDGVQNDTLGANGVINPLLVRSAIRLGDFKKARDILLRANPRFRDDRVDRVDRFNLSEAVMLAYVEQQLGNASAASEFLDQALLATTRLPRVGLAGHGMRDVQILTLQGRIPAALDRLQIAIDEGFVSEMAFDHWSIDADPLLEPLRDEPRFSDMRAEMLARVDTMRRSVAQAEQNDGWADLRAKTAASLSAAIR